MGEEETTEEVTEEIPADEADHSEAEVLEPGKPRKSRKPNQKSQKSYSSGKASKLSKEKLMQSEGIIPIQSKISIKKKGFSSFYFSNYLRWHQQIREPKGKIK